MCCVVFFDICLSHFSAAENLKFKGTLNIHPSLLPRWRGASPVQRSLEAGDNPLGVTVLYTVSNMDGGPIIAQKEYHVGDDEQASDVLPYLFGLGTTLLLDVLPDVVSGKITFHTAREQEESKAVAASLINVSEGELRVWQESATTSHNKVRAFSRWPGTVIYLRVGNNEEPRRTKVISTKVVANETAAPSQVVTMGKEKGSGLRVICFDGSILELAEVQPETKKVMDAKSFVNGLGGQSIYWVEPSAKKETQKK